MSKDNTEYSHEHKAMLYERYLNLAINRFEWENLPEGLESRIVEKNLIEHGTVMFFRDEETGGLLCLPCMGKSDLNVYGEPTKYTVIGFKYTKDVDIDNGIVIRNNALGSRDSTDLMLFAERINEVEQTMDVNLFQQSIPYFILCNEKERLTFKNIVKQIKEHKFVIFGRKGLDLKSIDSLNTKSEYLLEKLQDHKLALMNELLTFLGINNANTDKKERLISSEVNANNDFILVNIDHMYDMRVQAVEKINEMFGTDIKVSKREVTLDGRVHDGIEDNSRE